MCQSNHKLRDVNKFQKSNPIQDVSYSRVASVPSGSKKHTLELATTQPFNQETYLTVANSVLRQSLIKRMNQVIF